MFFSGLRATNKDLPVSLWGNLPEQEMDTLNMLRTSRKNKKLSAYKNSMGCMILTKHHWDHRKKNQ